MHQAVQSLTEREKETLRLLLGGHDAKSIARDLDLSVYTVNERLREARRKLRVASSREAARLLAEAEGSNSVGDKRFGVAPAAPAVKQPEPRSRRMDLNRPFVWLGGGMLIMALIIAVLLAVFLASPGSKAPPADRGAAAQPQAAETAETKLARQWLEMLDDKYWDLSWDSAGAQFKSSIPKPAWAARVGPLRAPLGAVTSRTLLAVTRTSALPGAPPGEFLIIQFDTNFASKPHAVETIQLYREASGWKVDGYFIR
ncbi:MAG: transcriptional regulator, LuxR family [Caulobacteraceae bacterium]|nr:transcriptional regulator, LuxR family [Caulobacteraceae bacterium]